MGVLCHTFRQTSPWLVQSDVPQPWFDSRSRLKGVQEARTTRRSTENSHFVQHKTAQQEEGGSTMAGGPWESLSLEGTLSCLDRAGPLEEPSVDSLTDMLFKCRRERNTTCASRLHAHLRQSGLETHPSLGSHLVSTLVEVGNIADARQLFNRLVYKAECAWSSLITGYIDCGQTRQAFDLYQEMREDASVDPSQYAFVALLKACADVKDMERGCKIHAHAAGVRILENDIYIANTLINMYAKCGSLARAQEVFDKLKGRNVVSWNALIAGYAQHGLGEEALNYFLEMQLEGVSSTPVTFVCILKACSSIGARGKGLEVHSEIAMKGSLDRDLVVGTALVDMYAKCGSLAEAQDVFDKLAVKNVISWTALIAGYSLHGHSEEALKLFERMQQVGPAPNAATFICSLKACGNVGAAAKGEEIHAEIARKGLLERDHVLGTALVDMYAKCGLLVKAQNVFNEVCVRDVVLWNTLIAGYVQQESWKEAMCYLEEMQREGVSPDAATFVYWLKACGALGASNKGQEVHVAISKRNLLERDLVMGNAIVEMYVKCGLLAKAREVFDMLPVRDVFSWNALIAGYTQHARGDEALNCFERMQFEGIAPDVHTFCWSLKACGSLGGAEKGQEIHAQICRKTSLESDLVVGTALVDMYAKCGLPSRAQDVFNKLPVRDVVLWTVLIASYAQHGQGEEALSCYERMRFEGLYPDAVTYICCLKACASIRAAEKGQELHAEISRNGSMDRNLVVGTALLDMYVKCGLLAKAQQVFDKLPARDVVSWNALMAGYAEHGCGEEVLNSFEQMQHERFSPDAVTYVCILKACGILGAMTKGQEIHAEISAEGSLETDDLVGNILIDMYAKCGLIAKAQELFDKLPIRNVVSWNALIAGYAQVGKVEQVFLTFEKMTGEGIKPDQATLSSMLNACSHTGLADKGQVYFESMSKGHSIIPSLEHHTCMIGILGRAGQLGKAVALIQRLPFEADLVLWATLLGACQKWGSMDLGRHIFQQATTLDATDPSAYVCMSNIYSDAGMQEDAFEIEALRVEKTSVEGFWTLLAD